MKSAIPRRSRWARRGASTVEFAIMTPVLIALILWCNYFWEVQVARIKAAEAARYVAFERTVRKDIGAIQSEAQQRYRDLNGADKTGTTPRGFNNQVTVTQITGQNAAAPLASPKSLSETGSQGGLGGMIGAITNLVGNTVESIIGLFGFKTDQGAVQANVEIKVKNRIIPARILNYMSGPGGTKLDLVFRDSYFVYHDTWRAWDNGLNHTNSYKPVEDKTFERVKKVAYLGLADAPGVSGVLNAIGKVLDVLGLDFPFSTDYIREMVYIKKVGETGRFPQAGRPTQTVPGGRLQAYYWRSDWSGCFNSCESQEIKYKRGTQSSGGWDDNFPMRSYNCRGPFFQGAIKSDLPESEYSQSAALGRTYFKVDNSSACSQ